MGQGNSMFGNPGAKSSPDLIYKNAGPPNFPAQYGTQVLDRDGVLWTQEADGNAQYWVATGYQGSYTSFIWSGGNWPQIPIAVAGFTVSGDVTAAQAYNIGGTGANNPADTTDYWTAFFVERCVKVYGLVLPILTAVTNSTNVKVKASIYRCHNRSFAGVPWKLANTSAVFSTPSTGLLCPSTADILMIPYSTATAEPVVLTPGKYYIRHMWGDRCNANFAGRVLLEPTGTNMYRMDRYRGTGSGNNWNTTTMNDTIANGAVLGSAGSTATTNGSIDHINWGMWVEVLN